MSNPDARAPNEYGIVSLDEAECRDILRRQRMCVLSMADDEQPYAVPIFYGYDGSTVYLGIAEGRKTHVLDRNPRLCLTVAETGPGDAWRSVLVVGHAEWISEAEERAEAIRVMMEHNRRPERGLAPVNGAASDASAPVSPRRHQRGRMLRVGGAQITGRAKG